MARRRRETKATGSVGSSPYFWDSAENDASSANLMYLYSYDAQFDFAHEPLAIPPPLKGRACVKSLNVTLSESEESPIRIRFFTSFRMTYSSRRFRHNLGPLDRPSDFDELCRAGRQVAEVVRVADVFVPIKVFGGWWIYR